MERRNKRGRHDEKCCYAGIGKWYSWDTPFGLSLSFAIALSAIGVFIYLLHISGVL